MDIYYKTGYIPPSGLLEAISEDRISAFNKKFENTPLRMGVIVKVYEKDDKDNSNKITTEYDVVTSELNRDMGQSFVKYPNCISTDSFGGIADFFEYKRRADTNNFEKTHDFKKQNGTMVLLLCLDGYSEKAVIIGGVKNTAADEKGKPVRETTLTKENGLHLEGEYNGINWQVNKNGEFTLTFKSKTNNEGKPQDEKSGGSYAKIDKTGSLELNTGLKGEEETVIKLDKTQKDAIIKVGNNVDIKAKKDFSVTADGEAKFSVKADMSMNIEGAAKVVAKSSIKLESDGALDLKAASVKGEIQGALQLKANSAIINAPSIMLGPSPLPATNALTLYLGIGNLGAPILCAAIGPFSSAVML